MLTVEEVKNDKKRFPSVEFGAKLEPTKGSQRPRIDPMCRVEIISLTDGQVIPGGHVIPAGVHYAEVHEKDVPIIEAMVERDLEAIEEARRQFDRKVKQSVAEDIKQLRDQSQEGEEYVALMARAYQEYPGSVAGVFRQRNDRDPLPFVSVKVMERGIPAPAAQAVTDMQKMTADLVAKQVGANSNATSEVVGAVIEQLVKAGVLNLGNNQQKK